MAANYWRVLFTANNGGAYPEVMGVGELYFYDNTSGLTEIIAETVTDSGNQGSGYAGDKAFDRLDSTGFASAIGISPSWVKVAFAAPKTITTLGMRAGPAVFATPTLYSPRDFKLQSSSNNVDWVDVLSLSNVTWAAPYEYKIFGFSPLGQPRNPRYTRDMVNGGGYRVVGTVDELGVLGRYRVRLCDRRTGAPLRETWSAADGAYAFNHLAYRAEGYFAVAFDHGASPQNAAIADLITPEPMP